MKAEEVFKCGVAMAAIMTRIVILAKNSEIVEKH